VGGRGMINLRVSKGVHLIVPKDRVHSSTGIIARTADSVLFIIPWGRYWIIGTTDTDWVGSKSEPAASRADIDYLIDQANRVLKTPLTRDDVLGVYAGLRPLVAGDSDATSRLSREHVVAHPVPGLVLVAGGKYTTYRLMARDAVDAVVHALDWRAPPSCTDRVPLAGADGYLALWNSRHRLALSSGLHVARIEHLLRRYGSLTPEVLALVEADPGLGQPVTGADDYLRAEIVYAASHEGARHLDDVLGRRTHIAVETPDRGMAALDEITGLIAGPLRWSARQAAREAGHYRAGIAAERASQEAGTDADADAIRGTVPDIVPVLGTGEASGNGARRRGGGITDGVRGRSH
jgi:glycerol-3-phosphate dehydrogenase